MSSFYVTTPIYYVNAHPHIGHAYTTIVADILARFHRLKGDDTWFLTGTDEHGEKIVQKAASENISPQEFTDKISREFQETWPGLHIAYDQFIRTTDPAHKKIVQKALHEINSKGFIYQDNYTGLYCLGCERYLDNDDLNEKGECRDHLKAPQEVSESNYFFKMSLFQEKLIQYIHNNPEWIFPESYRREVLGFLKEPLRDLCLSRPKNRLAWGVDLPFDDQYVTYVWFDALLNYISALGSQEEEKFNRYWPESHHLLGKDIVKTHCVYWPCMLMALDIPLPKKFVVHGFWNLNDSKISKSLGNVISPLDLKDKFGADAVRYYLAAAMSFGRDADFTQELFTEKYNSDLANNIGNLVSRAITLTYKNFSGQVPEAGELGSAEIDLQERLTRLFESQLIFLDQFELHKAATIIPQMGREVNRYIDDHEPWKLAKEPNKKQELVRVLNTQCACLQFIGAAIYPFMPQISQNILEAFDKNTENLTTQFFDWSELRKVNLVKKIPPLFPRVMETQ